MSANKWYIGPGVRKENKNMEKERLEHSMYLVLNEQCGAYELPAHWIRCCKKILSCENFCQLNGNGVATEDSQVSPFCRNGDEFPQWGMSEALKQRYSMFLMKKKFRWQCLYTTYPLNH